MGLSESQQNRVDAFKKQWATAQARGDTETMDRAHRGAADVYAENGVLTDTSGNAVNYDRSPITATANTVAVANKNTAADPYALKSANSQADYINQLYAAQQSAKLASLKSAYEANTADLNNTASQIPAAYNAARNSTAATSAVSQAAFNERAAANGLNSGAGGQASLSMANTLQGNLSSLDNAQASKLADLDTQREKLSSAYNNAIQQAVSENDASKAQALYNEAVRMDNSLVSASQAQASLDLQKQAAQTAQEKYADEQALEAAQARAAIGDYSGYQALYGLSAEDAEKYYKLWAMENPKAAAALSS